jgi:hypothetical protein
MDGQRLSGLRRLDLGFVGRRERAFGPARRDHHHSIDSTNNAQTWAWGTLSTETALTLTTSSITTGALLNLSGTARPPTRAPCLK